VPVKYDVAVITESRSLAVTTDFGTGQARYPEGIRVHVAVVAKWPVAGAKVTAAVRDPQGALLPDPLELFDDGLAGHGDPWPGDGVYSNFFYRYTEDGSYTFQLAILNENGTSASFTECTPATAMGEEGGSSLPVPPFAVRTSGSASVTGVPASLTPGGLQLAGNPALDGQQVARSQLSLTPVLDFTLDATPAESVLLERVTIRASTQIALEGIGEFSLFLDADQDGKVDQPPLPLAVGTFARGARSLDLRAGAAAPILAIPAGGQARFLVTAGGERLPSQAVVPLPVGPDPGFRPPWPLLLVLAALVVLSTRRSPTRPARPRLVRGHRAAAAAALVLGAGMLLLPSCNDSKRSAAEVRTGPLTIVVAPEDLGVTGATTARPAAVTGTAASARTTIVQ
jgi:hypothetical protein